MHPLYHTKNKVCDVYSFWTGSWPAATISAYFSGHILREKCLGRPIQKWCKLQSQGSPSPCSFHALLLTMHFGTPVTYTFQGIYHVSYTSCLPHIHKLLCVYVINFYPSLRNKTIHDPSMTNKNHRKKLYKLNLYLSSFLQVSFFLSNHNL